MTTTLFDVPLHRLLKRQEAAALLLAFGGLLPGQDLVLVRGDGRPFAGSGVWPETTLSVLLAQVRDGQLICTPDFLLQPLLLNDRLVGALVARSSQAESDEVTISVLHSLQHSLSLLLTQALGAREIARETLERYREVNLLYHIGETINACLDPDEITQLILEEARRVIAAETGMVLLASPASPAGADSDELVIKATFGPAVHLQVLKSSAQSIIQQVFQSGRPAIVPIVAFSPEDGSGEAGNLAIVLCVPLKTQERVLGVIALGRVEQKPEFSAGDEKLLAALAAQAAIAMETARLHQEEVQRQRLEEELAIGRQIQLSLLPKASPQVPGWEIAAVYRAAWQVGGDLYDFFELSGPSPRLGMVVADVTGKGVPAALFMAVSRTLIRTEAIRGYRPALVLRQVNKLLAQDNRSNLLLSAFYATLDTASGRLLCANGGHNWPLRLSAATGEVQRLRVSGILLGLFPDIELEEYEIELGPGDFVIFYTDGVTEARNAEGEFFGEEELGAILAADPDASAEQVLQAVVNAVESFSGDTPQSDDITFFVVKRQKTATIKGNS